MLTQVWKDFTTPKPSALCRSVGKDMFEDLHVNKVTISGVAKGSSISWVARLKGDKTFRQEAVKWVVAKLQGDKTASFCRRMTGCEATGWQISIPVFHGTLFPMDLWTPSRFLITAKRITSGSVFINQAAWKQCHFLQAARPLHYTAENKKENLWPATRRAKQCWPQGWARWEGPGWDTTCESRHKIHPSAKYQTPGGQGFQGGVGFHNSWLSGFSW